MRPFSAHPDQLRGVVHQGTTRGGRESQSQLGPRSENRRYPTRGRLAEAAAARWPGHATRRSAVVYVRQNYTRHLCWCAGPLREDGSAGTAARQSWSSRWYFRPVAALARTAPGADGWQSSADSQPRATGNDPGELVTKCASGGDGFGLRISENVSLH